MSVAYDTLIEWKRSAAGDWTRAGYWINSSDPIVSTRYLAKEGWLISSFLSGAQKMFNVLKSAATADGVQDQQDQKESKK